MDLIAQKKSTYAVNKEKIYGLKRDKSTNAVSIAPRILSVVYLIFFKLITSCSVKYLQWPRGKSFLVRPAKTTRSNLVTL